MKIYVVIEYTVIEYEECIQAVGVFSSIEKAEAAIKEYEEDAKGCENRYEYHWEEFKLDQVWEDEENE